MFLNEVGFTLVTFSNIAVSSLEGGPTICPIVEKLSVSESESSFLKLPRRDECTELPPPKNESKPALDRFSGAGAVST